MAITNYLIHFTTEATYNGKKSELRNDAVAFVKDATIIHTHGTDYYCGSGPVALKSDLSGYATTSALTSGLAGKANTSHTHTISQVSGLQEELNSKLESADLSGYALKTDIPSLSGGASATSGQYVSGVTVSGHEVTVTKATLPVTTLSSLGITATAAELNYMDGVTSNVQTQLNEIKESVDFISDPYEINLTNLLSAEDSESISSAIGGIDNLNATVQDNRIIVGTISNGNVSVSIRILGNVTTLYYLLDSVVGLTLNEVKITNTSGTLSKSVTTHSVITENMVINSLTSDETTLPLSAAQGKALDNKISSIDVSQDITNAINALDSAGQTASIGEVISSVSQENGIISVSKKTLAENDIPTLSIAKISDLQTSLDAKQDNLTAGTGLEITEGNVINVTLDTTVFFVAETAPASPSEDQKKKICLVPADTSEEGNFYTEYVWVVDDTHPDGYWEEFGTYKSEVDLTDYLKISDAESTYLKITDAESEYATKTELEGKQNSTDNALETTSKNIVGAINELNSKSDIYEIDLSNISGDAESEAISTAIGGWDNLFAAISNNKVIIATTPYGSSLVYYQIISENTLGIVYLQYNTGIVYQITNTEDSLSAQMGYVAFLEGNTEYNALNTTNKTILGAINEVNAALYTPNRLDVSTLFADSATITSELSAQIATYGNSSAPDFPVFNAGASIGNIKPTWIRTTSGVTNMMCIADNKIWYFEIQGTSVQRAELAIS